MRSMHANVGALQETIPSYTWATRLATETLFPSHLTVGSLAGILRPIP